MSNVAQHAASGRSGRVPRQSATLVVLRSGLDGVEILMLRRPASQDFGNAFVFPGGCLEPADAGLAQWCSGLDDAQASRDLGMAEGGLAYCAAAIRECFEESGVLLARDRYGGLLTPGSALEASRFADYRGLLLAGRMTLAELCREEGLTLAADQLTYFSYWITPAAAPRRYATRFFATVAPPRQVASHDGRESLEARWLSPRAALADETLVLPPPTRHALSQFAAAGDVAEALAKARRLLRAGVSPVLPVVTGEGAAAGLSIPPVADDDRPTEGADG